MESRGLGDVYKRQGRYGGPTRARLPERLQPSGPTTTINLLRITS
jgi:hypothetical protein